jgi:hypothetical protein
MVSWILPIVSLTSITIKRARYLYALLTETPIDFSSLVTTTMMVVRLVDQIIALPYGAMVTQIVEHAEVSTL